MIVYKAAGDSFGVTLYGGHWVMVSGNLPSLPAEDSQSAMQAISDWKSRNRARFNELAAEPQQRR